MDSRTLTRWNQSCASLKAQTKGAPFPNAAVFVTKSTNSATLIFWAELGICNAVRCEIGHDKANYQQIAQEILAVLQQHGLIDAKSAVLVSEDFPIHFPILIA